MLGAIYGAGIGDALGAPTELRNTKQIKELFQGYVYEYQESPQDTFARDYPAGTVTDDFSMSYYLMRSILNHQGKFDFDVAKDAICAWGNDEYYFDKFAGPTTRAAIEKMKAGLPTDIDPWGLINYNSTATNGGAMKTIPLAILAKGDLEKALQYTIDMCMPTHYNSNAISAAAAICCAATEAQRDGATLDSIFEAAIWGAEQGKAYGEHHKHISVGPDIAWKIREAIQIGRSATDFDDLLERVANHIGTNIQVAESIPAVFGIIAGVNGDLMQGIYAATNVGGDTDTIASMLGGILGGYQGLQTIPDRYITGLVQANPMLNIEEVVSSFVEQV